MISWVFLSWHLHIIRLMYRNEIINIKSKRAMTEEFTISAGTMLEGLEIDIFNNHLDQVENKLGHY